MKIAFCLHGLAGGVNDKFGGLPVDFEIGYEHFKRHILDKNNCDVFIHTWNIELKTDIINKYKPIKSIFEEQVIFDKPSMIRKLTDKEPKRKHSIYSRWYGTYKVLGLKKSYERENNFIYDYVFITRFDVAFFSDLIFSDYKPEKFYAAYWDKIYSLDGMYVPGKLFYQEINGKKYKTEPKGFPHDESGLLDFWFFSNSEIMDIYGGLFNSLDAYLKTCELSNHKLIVHHLKEMNIIDNLEFILHRYKDFELVRTKFLNSKI